MRNGQDHERWLQCRGIAMRDAAEKPVRMAGSQSDITARKLAERKLERAAYVDPLTGLSNRARFLDRLATLLPAGQVGTPALMVINLERLKRLSDSLGQKITEGMLVAVASRLEAACHANELLARIDTDEFALLLTGDSALDARWRAAEIWGLLIAPIIVGETEFEIGVRIGMTTAGLGAQTGEEMVREAHLALEWSSSDGDAAVFMFDATMHPQQLRRSRLESDLPAAVRGKEIFVEYQPVIALADSRLIAFEALARWRHPELGLVPPNDFIPIAEQSGAIQRLGHEVMCQAAAQLEEWRALGLDTSQITVAVNFSASQLADRRSVRRLLAFLDNIPPVERRLNLEITESILLADPDGLVDILADIKGHGVALSLDDFGTGYSSLSYLQKFPFDILKIDRSFSSRLTIAEDARRLVRSIIQLGHDLGLIIVAEGVETIEERELLAEFGCDAAQGYLFAKPMAAERTVDFLRPIAGGVALIGAAISPGGIAGSISGQA
jgi:diguanylate cyclase (GGDEF)-like protein